MRRPGERGHGDRAKPSLGRQMPMQKPGRSEQTVGTPWEFIDAVEARFGALKIDLASDAENAKAPKWITEETDSLSPQAQWAQMLGVDGVGWLNPPFGHIAAWAEKCRRQSKKLGAEAKILLLVPASIGANWFWDSVAGRARVFALRPRIQFVGHAHPYPKDLVLAEYRRSYGGSARIIRLEEWTWKESKR